MFLICDLLFSLIFEVGFFSDYRQKRRGGSAWLVHASFPFADGLLSSAQTVGHLLLGQAQMLAQSLDTLPIPLRLSCLIFLRHPVILHAS